MPTIHRPRRGSLAFSPRKRAKSEIPRIRSWKTDGKKAALSGFAGYKAGMTHVIMIDDRENSLTQGMEINVPVTVLETPPMSIAALRVYEKFNGGLRPLGEVWAEELDPDLSRAITAPKSGRGVPMDEFLALSENAAQIRAIGHTRPRLISGVPKKMPEMMEFLITGGTIGERFDFAKGILGTQVPVSSVFGLGDLTDVTAITTGKGTQGPVKRWGIMLQKRKHARTGKLRHVGNLGPWHPARVRWTVPQLGQTGYHQRTEYNKRILAMGSNGSEITPAGGFPGYGIIRNEYVLIKGSLPGPTKRLVSMKRATRAKQITTPEPKIIYTSRESKQGLRSKPRGASP